MCFLKRFFKSNYLNRCTGRLCLIKKGDLSLSALSRPLRIATIVFTTLHVSTLPAIAAEDLQGIEVIADEEIITTGDVVHEEFSGSHVRVQGEALERQDVTLGEILAFETGVQFRQFGGAGSLSAVSIRGGSNQQTGVYLDGIALHNAGNSVVNLATIDLLNVESADVYRGSSPIQLSQGALAGAVNLNTLGGNSAKPFTKAHISGGSFSTQKFQLAHQSTHKAWDVTATASQLNSANDYPYINNNGTVLNTADDRLETRQNSQTNQLGALAKIGYSWNALARTDLVVQANYQELGVPEWRNLPDNDALLRNDSIQYQLMHTQDGLGDWNSRLTLFQHVQNDGFSDTDGQIGLGSQDTARDVNSNGLQAYIEHIGERGTLGFSANIRSESLVSADDTDAGENYQVERNSANANVQYAFFTANDTVLIAPSVRWQSIRDNFQAQGDSNNSVVANSIVTPQLGIKYTPSSKLTLRANLGLFHREPVFFELFGGRGLIRGTPNLKPERGINSDLGIDVQWSSQFSSSASLFSNWRDELIAIIFNSRGVGSSVNVGEARVIGLEMANNFKLNERISGQLNWTLQDTTNLSDFVAFRNNQLPGQARSNVYARVQMKNKRSRLWLELESKSEHFYDSGNRLAAPAYFTQNVGVDLFWKQFQASLAVNNVNDVLIEDFNGFQRPGRAFFLSFTYRL